MTIAYVLNTYPQPSQSFIRREIAALERQGGEVVRIAMRRSEAALVDPADAAEAGRTIYVLEQGAARLARDLTALFLRRPRATLAALALALRLGRASRVGRLRHLIYLGEAAHVMRRAARLGVHHIHAHFGTNAATVAMLARALGGPPFSFTVHGPEEFDAPHALALGEKAQAAAFGVAVSQFGRSQLCRWVPYARWNRLHVVHCGIEPGKFATPPPLQGGPLRLVAIGRFSEQKGQMILIEAMARLAKMRPDIRLTLVGDGPLRGEIEAAVAHHGLGGVVRLTGWLDEAGVNAALAEAQALVMPSFAEGLPMVIMEAMAAARPVIATYVAGIPELVLDGQTGWLVPAGDVAALVEAILRAADTPLEALTAMGDAGRRRALARHDIDVSAQKLRALIDDA